MRQKILTLISVFLLPLLANAAVAAQMQNAEKFIADLTNTLTELNKTSAVPVLFPEKVIADKAHQQYFANSDSYVAERKSGYQINVDYAADCHGAHYCNVGYIRGEKIAQPELQKNRQGKVITQKVTLAQNITGYYTAGHAEGSYFPPTLQWQHNKVLYTLSWDDHFTSKALLITMANSAITHP